MTTATLAPYDAKVDSKKRITLKGAQYDYYHVEPHEDGTITLSPRQLVAPFEISANTLHMMDESMENLKRGVAGPEIDLDALED